MSAERGQPFLSPEDLQVKARDWQRASMFEVGDDGGYDYPATRTDRKITEIYGESVVEGVIPRLLKTKKPSERVSMLDIGGGAGVLAEQVRQAFGDKVKVYTTGLAKKPARAIRREEHEIDDTLSNGLRPEDLKWRSILQLTDYPEFDFIQDTYGEAYHGVTSVSELQNYFGALCDKLLPDGEARIIILPVSVVTDNNPEQKVKEIVQEMSEYKNVEVSFKSFKKERFSEMIVCIKKKSM